jgi:hypothetical protein
MRLNNLCVIPTEHENGRLINGLKIAKTNSTIVVY